MTQAETMAAETQLERHTIEQLRQELAAANRELESLKNDAEFHLVISGRLHRSLLPGPINHPRIDVDVKYLPLDAVSGNYCQVHFPGPTSCYFTTCDVSGRGVGPCLLATRVSSEVRHFILNGLQPQEIVAALNAFIFAHIPDFHDTGWRMRFMAASYNLESKALSYSCAGASSPLLLRDSACDVLASQNPPIGVRRNILAATPEHTRTLAAGDRLLFYTQGLTSTTNEKAQPLGTDGLARLAVDARNTGVFDLGDRIFDQLAQYRYGDPHDDMTLIVAEAK